MGDLQRPEHEVVRLTLDGCAPFAMKTEVLG